MREHLARLGYQGGEREIMRFPREMWDEVTRRENAADYPGKNAEESVKVSPAVPQTIPLFVSEYHRDEQEGFRCRTGDLRAFRRAGDSVGVTVERIVPCHAVKGHLAASGRARECDGDAPLKCFGAQRRKIYFPADGRL